MKFGIIFAMKEELEAAKEYFDFKKKYNFYNLEILEYEYKNCTCYFLESGIGKVNAARATQVLIDKFEIDYILNVGVAGGVMRGVLQGDVVIAEKLVQHDYDLTSFGHEKGLIPGVGKYIPCDEKLISLAKKVKLDNKVHTGVVASGDIFVFENWMGEKINTKFNAMCVEMEGAAIAQVCYLCKIPFLVIRSISDSPYQDDNKVAFLEFLEESCSVVAEFLKKFLNNF